VDGRLSSTRFPQIKCCTTVPIIFDSKVHVTFLDRIIIISMTHHSKECILFFRVFVKNRRELLNEVKTSKGSHVRLLQSNYFSIRDAVPIIFSAGLMLIFLSMVSLYILSQTIRRKFSVSNKNSNIAVNNFV